MASSKLERDDLCEPAPPFDPSDRTTVTDEFLRRYCLPPRPTTSQAYANWLCALTDCTFPAGPLTPDQEELAATLARIKPRSFPAREASQETSRNWSGAYVRPRPHEGDLLLVQGWWRMPKMPLNDPPDRIAFTYSMWAGLDGHDPTSKLMPQVGVGYRILRIPIVPESSVTVTVKASFFWYQWWDKFFPEQWQQPVVFIALNEGDLIYAQVAVLGVNKVSFFIKNQSTGQAFTLYSSAPTVSRAGKPRPVPPTIERRTAEWILERPHLPDFKDYEVKLGRYGQADFSNCIAVTRTADGQDHEFALEHARTMRMVDWNDRDKPGRIVSVPTIDRKHGRLRLDYVGPP